MAERSNATGGGSVNYLGEKNEQPSINSSRTTKYDKGTA